MPRASGPGSASFDLAAPAQPFPDRFDGRSARVRAFLLYLASLNPLSLRDEGALDPGELLSTVGTGAVGYVSKNQSLEHLIGSPANRMFVDRGHVGQVFLVLQGMSDLRLRELLPTHGFPVDSIRRLKDGDRAGLIQARLKTLIDGEREFMTRLNVVPPAERTAATVAGQRRFG